MIPAILEKRAARGETKRKTRNRPRRRDARIVLACAGEQAVRSFDNFYAVLFFLFSNSICVSVAEEIDGLSRSPKCLMLIRNPPRSATPSQPRVPPSAPGLPLRYT